MFGPYITFWIDDHSYPIMKLCFLSPHENYLSVAFVLGAKAVETALKSKLPDAIKKQVRESPQYPEGRGVRFVIKLKKDLAPARMLLEIKKSA